MGTKRFHIRPGLFVAFALLISGATLRAENQAGPVESEITIADAFVRTDNAVNYITLRNRTGSSKAAEFYGDERSETKTGICVVARAAMDSLKPITEIAPFHVPNGIAWLDSVNETAIDELWQVIEKGKNNRPPLVYIHGFNISFERACKRASRFQEALGVADRFLLFSWPSDGTITNYTHDEADIYWSVAPLVEILDDMIARFGAGNIDIVAHSLGSRGLFFSLVRLASSKQPKKPLFNNIVLVAPDIDAGIFRQYFPQARSMARKITLYVSGNDSPLALSGQVHGYPRLGQTGPHLNDLKGIEIIDVSNLSGSTPTGHLYHLYNKQVIDDLSQLLNEGKYAARRERINRAGENYWWLDPAAQGD